MTLFRLIRAQVLPALPTPCLVAPDRTGRALLVSDFPARYDAQAAEITVQALHALGFACVVTENTARIDWTQNACAGWLDGLPMAQVALPSERTFPLWGICRTLRRHDKQGQLPDMEVFRRAFHLIIQKDLPALTRCLNEALAVALRKKTAPPAGVARLILYLGLI